MNWFSSLISRFRSSHDEAREARGPLDDFWYGPVGMPVWSGAVVTPETALLVPAVWDCLNVISKPIAHLPLAIFERVGEGEKKRTDKHPLFEILHDQPNDEQTACEFRGQMQFDLGIHNNAYAEIVPGRRGAVDQLVRLDPQRVTAKRTRPGGPVAFRHFTADGRVRDLRQDQVWHLRGLPFGPDGITAKSPVTHGPGLQTIGKALALMEYAARFFQNDTQTGGIVKYPHRFPDNDSRANWLHAWRASRSGANRHRDSLLEDGMEYIRGGQTNREAQFIDAEKETNLAITRIWQVPPHKVGMLERATNNNIEQQALEFISDTLLPWIVLWEQAISRDLIVGGRRFFAEFNVAGLLRGDLKTRYEAFAVGRNWGWLSVNDIRRLENMNPIPGGDLYLQPLNMIPAGDPAEPSGQGKPNGKGNGATAWARDTFPCIGEQGD